MRAIAWRFTEEKGSVLSAGKGNRIMKYMSSLIAVNDIEVSRDFYEKTLKQKIKYYFGENIIFHGDFAIHLTKHFHGLLNIPDGETGKGSHDFELYFECENIEDAYHELKGNNVEFIHEIKEQPWQQRVMRFYDPDHNISEVGETTESGVMRLLEKQLNAEEISKKHPGRSMLLKE